MHGSAVKRGLIVAVAASGFLLAALSVAWACTEQAHFTTQSPTALPGEVITVQGHEWVAHSTVELRWHSQDGATFARVTTGEQTGELGAGFTVEVTIPADAQPGRLMLYGVTDDPTAYPSARYAPMAIEVADPNPAPPVVVEQPPVNENVTPPANENVTPPANENVTPPANENVTPPANENVTPPASEAVTPPATSQPPAPAQVSAPAPAPARGATQPVAPAVTEPAPASVSQAAPEPTTAPAVANTDWRHTHGAQMNAVPATTPNTDWRHTHGALLNGGPASPDTEAHRAHSDVAAPERGAYEWAGVSEGSDPLGAGLGAGLGLLAIGLIVLFGGAAVATVARRKSEAKVSGR